MEAELPKKNLKMQFLNIKAIISYKKLFFENQK